MEQERSHVCEVCGLTRVTTSELASERTGGQLHGCSLSTPTPNHLCIPTEAWARSVLTATGWSPAEVHHWWRAPSGYLPDRARPIDHADVDPDRVRWLVREKAKRPGV